MRKAKLLSLMLMAAVMGLAVQAEAKKRTVRRKPLPVSGVVNINKAPLKKIALLPYVGRSRARAILKYRAKQKFRQPVEITKVKGIGKRTFKRIKRHVTVTGPTTIKRVRSGSKRTKSKKRKRKRS